MLTTSLKCVALCCQVCSLFCNVARFFQENASKLSKVSNEAHSSDVSNERANVSSENAPEFPPNLLVEWQEFFSGNLFTTVLQMFLYHAGKREGVTLCLYAYLLCKLSPWGDFGLLYFCQWNLRVSGNL